MKAHRHGGVLVLAFAIAGCSAGTSLDSVAPHAPAASAGKTATLTLRIRVPKKLPQRLRVVRNGRPRYVSPATQAVQVTVAGPNAFRLTQTFSLQPSATGCSQTQAGNVCAVSLTLAPCATANCYTGAISTYDAVTGCPAACSIPGSANALSENEAFAFSVTAGQSNTIAVTLAGIPAKTVVTPTTTWVENHAGVYDLLGQGARGFLAEALDADGNIIAGFGAPRYTIAAASGTLSGVTASVTQTTQAAPNAFSLTPPTSYASGSAAFTVTPVFPTGPSGCSGTCTAATLTVDMQPVLYISNAQANASAIFAYDQSGNTMPTPGGFPNNSFPEGIAYDPVNGDLYVANDGDASNVVAEYDQNGNSIAGLSDTGPGAEAIAEANGLLYVTLANGTVTAYDGSLVAQTLSGSFSGLKFPFGIVYDSANGHLYVSNNFRPSAVYAYDLNGNQQTTAGGFPNLNNPLGMTVDSANGFIYVANSGNNTITVYDENGNQQTTSGSFPNLNAPNGIAYDPANQWLYVAQVGGVTAYDQNGNQQTITGFAGLPVGYAISIVP